MKRLISYILLGIACCSAITGEAKTIRDIFTSEPGNIFKILPASSRMDMLDYFDIGQKVQLTNTLSYTNEELTSQIIDVTDAYIGVALTSATSIHLTLLTPSASDSIVMVVKTSQLPAPDSRIAFYNTNWEQIATKKVFAEPQLSDFILPSASKDARAEISKTVKFPIISYEVTPGQPDTIVARLNIDKFLSEDDWNAIKQYFATSITYRLSGKKFKRTSK